MAASVLYVLTNSVTFMGVTLHKGITLALTAAQVTLIGAGNLRPVNAPAISTQTTTTSGGTSTVATQAASPTHDTLGKHAGVSNSA
jgi:hypothetical protein